AGYHFFLSAAEREARFKAAMERHPPGEELWVFAYGSLMWNPAFEHDAQFLARVQGWHRRFCVRNLIGRGTAETHPA
ncbi:MAG TPA: gamma-glutamylcyclotransferase, partial [Ramlibacter sp.]|nr:gamma-glutamylcyclotransferase [Ramlibacter sp.]